MSGDRECESAAVFGMGCTYFCHKEVGHAGDHSDGSQTWSHAPTVEELTAENARLTLEVATLRACLIGCIDRGEVGHNEDCPEDDTCDCRHIAAINAALGAAKPHTCPESDPGPEDITLAKDCLACIALGAAK